MEYSKGNTIQQGDLCWHAERRQIAKVAKIVESYKDKESYGVSESGIFLCLDLSLNDPELDLFIGDRFFFEEEVDVLSRDEQILLFHLKELASEKLETTFGEGVAYSIRCIDNSVEKRPPLEREWAIKFYRAQDLFEEEYVVCGDFSGLKES